MNAHSSPPRSMSFPPKGSNARAILAMIASSAVFVCNDALVKLATSGLPVGQIMLVRGLFACAWVGLAVLATGDWRRLGQGLAGPVLHRALLDVGATVFFIMGLVHIPLANASSIMLAAPLLITALAVPMLGAQVGWRRWSAILVGFVGVLLIVRPTPAGFNVWSLSTVTSLAFVALRDIVTRRVAPGTGSGVITLTTAATVTLLGIPWTLVEGWAPLDGRGLALVAGASVFLALGYFFLIVATRSGDIAVVQPFRYALILWSLALGYAIWDDVPDALAFGGIALVVASGLYVLHRERIRIAQAARQAKVDAAAPAV
ncbi:MAG: DMT family transporter [Alphaproteobacteria bacterium]|nr:DMT family transporter [Alphaproteobacteria bacterium]